MFEELLEMIEKKFKESDKKADYERGKIAQDPLPWLPHSKQLCRVGQSEDIQEICKFSWDLSDSNNVLVFEPFAAKWEYQYSDSWVFGEYSCFKTKIQVRFEFGIANFFS